MIITEPTLAKQTITKGEADYSSGKEAVKVTLSEPKRWVDLEVWLDIRSKTELFKTVTIKLNFVDPSHGGGSTEISELKLTTPNLQQNHGLTNDIQEMRIPFDDLATEDTVQDIVEDSLINSFELEFDMEGVVAFYYRVKG